MISRLEKTTAICSILVLLFGVGLATAKYTLDVEGLSCPFCAYGLEKKLKGLEGVEEVSIDLNKGKVVVVAKEPIKEEKIRGAVQDAGFQVASMKKESQTKSGQ